MAHLAPKLLKMDNMAQYGFLWHIGVYAAIYGSIWLQMDLNGSQLPVLLHMAQDCPRWLMKAIWLLIDLYGS